MAPDALVGAITVFNWRRLYRVHCIGSFGNLCEFWRHSWEKTTKSIIIRVFRPFVRIMMDFCGFSPRKVVRIGTNYRNSLYNAPGKEVSNWRRLSTTFSADNRCLTPSGMVPQKRLDPTRNSVTLVQCANPSGSVPLSLASVSRIPFKSPDKRVPSHERPWLPPDTDYFVFLVVAPSQRTPNPPEIA